MESVRAAVLQGGGVYVDDDPDVRHDQTPLHTKHTSAALYLREAVHGGLGDLHD